MAIEQVDRLPPHVALRAEIAKHRRSMMVAASGMGPVLEILDAYVASTESRFEALESARAVLAEQVLRLDASKDVRRPETVALL